MKKILSIIILFFLTTTLSANDRDVELDKLFLELKKNIPSLSSGIAQQIWMLWSTKYPIFIIRNCSANLDVMEYSSNRSKTNIYFR